MLCLTLAWPALNLSCSLHPAASQVDVAIMLQALMPLPQAHTSTSAGLGIHMCMCRVAAHAAAAISGWLQGPTDCQQPKNPAHEGMLEAGPRGSCMWGTEPAHDYHTMATDHMMLMFVYGGALLRSGPLPSWTSSIP
jgi:hypothetical protein